jgi:hypothetical protein
MDASLTEAIGYLRDYSAQLEKVDSEAALYEGLPDWQFQNLDRGSALQDDINKLLFAKPGADLLRLRSENPPTTAIGSLRNIVILAANPGFGEGNSGEIALRQDPHGNRSFCSDFFTRHGDHSRNIDWWKRVVAFAFEASTGQCPKFFRSATDDRTPSEQRYSALWAWAGEGNVGAVDLIPFHSAKDGLTHRLVGPLGRKGARSDLLDALANAAVATIDMVLRLGPRLVVVGSPAGATLAGRAARGLGWERVADIRCEIQEKGDWPHAHSYVLHHWKGPRTSLLTVDGQLFSAQGGLAGLRKALPKVIYKNILSGDGPTTRLCKQRTDFADCRETSP